MVKSITKQVICNCFSVSDGELQDVGLGLYPRLHYPDPHPSHAVQLLRVAKLQHYCGDVEQAERTFTQAYNVMKVTHGTHHPLVSEVSRKLLECLSSL
ncbi:hypothetical protein QTP70_011710 [Hemibagrus guttatus]|uniref:Uncharacterized protein n=1 Tax=Hemibagrus guttatus TaxID=175788 RepID=A0AAE0QZK5_9TELE|nr:hypothetical protein QTP70_011710 [Hemibagrus guttatus]